MAEPCDTGCVPDDEIVSEVPEGLEEVEVLEGEGVVVMRREVVAGVEGVVVAVVAGKLEEVVAVVEGGVETPMGPFRLEEVSSFPEAIAIFL